MTQTYAPLATTTLSSSATSVTFSNIPATYRDLVVVISGTNPNNRDSYWRANGDSGLNYSYIQAGNSGGSTFSNSFSGGSEAWAGIVGPVQSSTILQFMDYSATNKHKVALSRGNIGGSNVIMQVSRWANSAAITSIAIIANGNFNSGSIFSMYGVLA